MVAAFSALAIASYQAGQREEEIKFDREVLKEMGRIRTQLETAVTTELKPEPDWNAGVENCGFDTCIPVDIRFKPDEAELLPEGRSTVSRLCSIYQQTLHSMQIESREIVLVIEGHTDPTIPEVLSGPARSRYNWDLSGMRASTVLQAFIECGVSVAHGFEISAAGYADSRPVAKRKDDLSVSDWYSRLRRITLRIRLNQDLLRARLQKSTRPPSL